MWIVKNTLRATLTLRGLNVSIAEDEEFDLDTLGREAAEASNQVLVAFEEGYLENVRKEPLAAKQSSLSAAAGATTNISMSDLDAFKTEFMAELRSHLPSASGEGETKLSAAISDDVKELVTELKSLKGRFSEIKGRVTKDDSLSAAEVKARLAFLDEQERELLKNFETVGKQVEQDDGDVMDMADMLSNL